MSIPWYNKRINVLEAENKKHQEELIKHGQEIVGLKYLLKRSREEFEIITNKLAYIRDEIFDDEDYVSDDGYDLTGNYAGSPYEVLCGVETKILRQQKMIEELKNEIESIYEIYCDI